MFWQNHQQSRRYYANQRYTSSKWCPIRSTLKRLFRNNPAVGTVRSAEWIERFILTVKCNTGIGSICGGSPFWGQWKGEAIMTRHHVGHQPFIKAPLLGTLSSRHLLCPTLHRGGDPKTVFFSEPGPILICDRPGKHKWAQWKTWRAHGSLNMMPATYIYSGSCRCSCFSSGQGSPDHTPEHPGRPVGRGEGLARGRSRPQPPLGHELHGSVRMRAQCRIESSACARAACRLFGQIEEDGWMDAWIHPSRSVRW